jgi:hypothetical protein
LILKKWRNPDYKLLLVLGIVITLQGMLTIKHYSYHYLLPSQLLIIPGVLAAWATFIKFKPSRILLFGIPLVCGVWLLYNTFQSATIFKNGNRMYESGEIARKYSDMPRIITTAFQESSFVESALHYATSYAGKYPYMYFYILRTKYPHSYFYDLSTLTLKWFERNITIPELFEKYPRLLIYLPNMEETAAKNTINRIIAGNESVVSSITLDDYNKATGERFYILSIDTSKTQHHFSEKEIVKYDFEQQGQDYSALLSSDRHTSGFNSIRLVKDQYACCRTFAVKPGDKVEISVNNYATGRRPGGISLTSPSPGFFDKTSESIEYDYKSGWKKLLCTGTIPDNYPDKEVKFCLFNWGDKPTWFDDLSIVISKK